MFEMKTMCGDGSIRVQPPRLGGGLAKAPAQPEAWGNSSQRLCSALGARSRSKKRRSGWAGLVAGGRAGVRGLPRRGGQGAGTQPQLPGPQLRPRAQEQIVLGGGGGGGGSGGSGPPRSQAENQQREAAGERGEGRRRAFAGCRGIIKNN